MKNKSEDAERVEKRDEGEKQRKRGMAFRVGFWGRRTKILGIGFDIAVETGNRFFLADFFIIITMI